MDFIWESITEELKKWLVGGIMEQLSGMFDAVNRQVGDVAAQVGTSPADFSPRIFSMIQNISESVIIPIAGIILTIIACYELIQMIIEHNNLANFDTWIIISISFEQIDDAPDAKSGTNSHYKCLKYSNCLIKKCHKQILAGIV